MLPIPCNSLRKTYQNVTSQHGLEYTRTYIYIIYTQLYDTKLAKRIAKIETCDHTFFLYINKSSAVFPMFHLRWFNTTPSWILSFQFNKYTNLHNCSILQSFFNYKIGRNSNLYTYHHCETIPTQSLYTL